MTGLAFLGFVYVTLSIQAAPCDDGQHCTDCHVTGDCRTKCERGYFDKKCSSRCSSGCKNNSCIVTSRGFGNCTEGCVTGYQGTSCKIPCDAPGGGCTQCPGVCDGEYCQLGSSCVSGCRDSYYGPGCKTCSTRCQSCNRTSGLCDICHSPYSGQHCEGSCENCLGSCRNGCVEGCKPGFFGPWCDKICSKTCKPSLNMHQNGTPVNVTPDCNKETGGCSHGCVDGWYGADCTSRCSSNCRNRSCTASGACRDGCIPGYSRHDCTCHENCFKQTCYSKNGSCMQGCVNGFYGVFCNITCSVCLYGVCDQISGMCVKGCNISGRGCDSACKLNCPIEECHRARSCDADADPNVGYRGIITGLTTVLVLVGILLVTFFCLWKGLITKVKCCNHQSAVDTVEYRSSRYWDIEEADMDAECEVKHSNDEEAVMFVLADHFQDIRNGGSSSDSDSDSDSEVPDDTTKDNYSRLMGNVLADEPKRCVKYVSPVNE